MNTRLLTALVVVGSLFAPFAARAAADAEKDRAHPVAFVKDSAITTKIKTRLTAQKLSSMRRVSVDTDGNGVVVLSGTARTQKAIDKAGSIARATEGVTSVQNKLTIKKDD